MGGPIAFSRPIVRRLVLAVAPALLACGPPAAGTGGTVIVVDDAGDSVSVRAASRTQRRLTLKHQTWCFARYRFSRRALSCCEISSPA